MSENEKMEQGQGSASASEKADKAKKDKKPEKQKKPSIFARIGKWLKDMKSELKTLNITVIVSLCVIVVGIVIWLFAAVAGALIEFLLGLFR